MVVVFCEFAAGGEIKGGLRSSSGLAAGAGRARDARPGVGHFATRSCVSWVPIVLKMLTIPFADVTIQNLSGLLAQL